MSGVALLLTIAFGVVVLAGSRRLAVLAYLGAALYITQGEGWDVLGINMTPIRLVEVVAVARVLARREWSKLRFTRPDKILLAFLLVGLAIFSARTMSVNMYQIGLAADGVLVFIAIRSLLVTKADLEFVLRSAAILLVPLAYAMLMEARTGVNIFATMGGVPETPVLREGYYRCQGSFRHAITAGTVGATFLPFFLGNILKGEVINGGVGLFASSTIVGSSHSSGPLLTALVGLFCWLCWPLRRRLYLVRRSLVIGVITLDLVMKAPVWFIFDRLSGYIGGDGWHRANLIDRFVTTFSDWWIAGMSMELTANWAATVTPWGTVDVTNYYVSIGLNSGLLALILFIAVFVSIFKQLGRALAKVRQETSNAPVATEKLLWGAGSVVCAHAVSLSSVSYWDQVYVIWYLHLAIAIAASDWVLSRE
jgi:hypothetical protein